MMKCSTIQITLLILTGIATNSLSAQTAAFWGIRASGGFVSPYAIAPEVNGKFQVAGPGFGLELSRQISISDKLEIELSGGIFRDQLPRNKEYGTDCIIDAYSTFLSYQDSLFGRGLRFWELRVGPSVRYRLAKPLSLGVGLWGAYTLSTGIEDYPKVCDRPRESTWIHLENAPNRRVRRWNFGTEAFLSFDLRSAESQRLLLEPGFNIRWLTRVEVSNISTTVLRTASGFLRFGYYF